MWFGWHKTYILIVTLVFVIVETSVVDSACPVEAKTATFGNIKACYWKNRTRVNWMTALQSCRDWGGNLASIHSRAEDEFIADEIARHVADTDYAPWIGLVNLQDKFAHYSDGTPYDYNGWLPKQPNDNRQQCGTVLFQKQHGWNDVACSHKVPFICKIVLTMSCEDDTCHNAGSCTVAWNGLPTCHCLPYYEGEKCETVKQCPKNSQLDYYSGACECVAGYEPADTHGIFCSPCAMNFSKSISGNTKCRECPSTEHTVGIGSTYCVEGSNPARPCTASGMRLVSCKDDTCRNGGSCTVAWNGLPTCHCLPYYEGNKCETVKKCPRNSQLDYYSGTCECVAGYEPADTHGIFCSPCAMNFSKSISGNTKCRECPSTEHTVGIGSTYCVEGSNPARPCTASGLRLGATLGIVGSIVAVNALCLLILVHTVCKKLKSRRQGEMLQWDESHVLRPAPPQYQPVQVVRMSELPPRYQPPAKVKR